MGGVRARAAWAAVVIVLLLPGTAGAQDYAETALNIIPSGQYGAVPPPAGADEQAKMYDELTPLFDQVSTADLFRTFKSERFGVDTSGPGRVEPVPRAGVQIVRDRFNVPHITGRTSDDVTWAMGWTLAQDRALLLAQARYPARLAAVDAPNLDAFGLVVGLKTFTPTRQVDRIVERNGLRALRGAGREGRRLLHDIDVYVQGINARLRADRSPQKPFTRTDIFAVNALVGQIFGEGGGDEAPRSAMLDGLRDRLGSRRAEALFDDLTEQADPDSTATLSESFRYAPVPRSRTGNALLDAGSYRPAELPGAAAARAAARPEPKWASNFLMVGAQRSVTGNPLFVAGPQIGYFYPGLTLEADVRGPGYQARGATAPGFPGTVLIGRGPDYAWSLTSAGSDLIDTYVETLCGGSRTRYRYEGRCRRMGRIDAGVVKGEGRVRFRTTLHGPVIGYGKVRGRTVALSSKRASAGRDVLFQLPFRRLTRNQVDSAESFYAAMGRSPFTFNTAYADDRDIAMYSSGRLPLRDRRVDPRLPTRGTGDYEWRGFLAARDHPQQKNPPGGVLVNWNNRPAPRFGSADDNWRWGSAQRVALLQQGLAQRGRHDLASVTGAMNAAATQDLRNVVLTPTLDRLLGSTPAPSARAAQSLELLRAWQRTGSSRLDRGLDGVIDAGPGPAIMDAAYPRLLDAVMGPALGRQLEELKTFVGADAYPGGGFTGGGFWYLDKDLRRLLGTRFRQPLNTRFCGRGDLAACRRALWGALEAAAGELSARQGPDPAAWRADARSERITFAPGVLPTTIRYTNRPSGIQQVISFNGHRPRD